MIDEDTLAFRLRSARIALEWTQKELATRAHCTLASLQKVEQGLSRNPRTLHQIARALGVHVAWLAYGINVDRIRDIANDPGLPPDIRHDLFDAIGEEAID